MINGSDAYLLDSTYNCTEVEERADGYLWPKVNTTCTPFDNGIYVHPIVKTEKTSIQSFTIDTDDMNTTSTITAFYVKGLSGAIGQSKYKNSNLRVEIYGEGPEGYIDLQKSILVP